MPKVSGIFEQFRDIDLIPIDDIVNWLKPAPNLYFLENYVANLIFYPQIIPDTEEELNIELALLRELLKRSLNFYDLKNRKIIIPADFAFRFPDTAKLVWAFIDGMKQSLVLDKNSISDVNKIVLAKKAYELNLGTVFIPKFSSQTGGLIDIGFEELPDPKAQKFYNLNQGSAIIILCHLNKSHMSFKSKDAKLLGKEENILEVVGGEVGIIIDARG